MRKVFTFDGVDYLVGTAGSLIIACPVCGEEHFREPKNYFWSLVPENKAMIDSGRMPEPPGSPERHKCFECGTQMVPIRVDELEERWKPFWRSLGWVVCDSDPHSAPK